MSKLVKQNHPALHAIADEVALSDIKTPRIKKVLKDMRTALDAYNVKGFNGIAIAAPQIGVPLRIFLVHNTDIRKDEENLLPDLIAINPRLIKLSKKKHVVGEGCLSVGDDYGAVKRSTHATIRAYDEHGNEYERGAGGLLAQVFQHECDHLDGILFIDKAEKVWNKESVEAKKLHEAHFEEPESE